MEAEGWSLSPPCPSTLAAGGQSPLSRTWYPVSGNRAWNLGPVQQAWQWDHGMEMALPCWPRVLGRRWISYGSEDTSVPQKMSQNLQDLGLPREALIREAGGGMAEGHGAE